MFLSLWLAVSLALLTLLISDLRVEISSSLCLIVACSWLISSLVLLLRCFCSSSYL